MDSSTPTHLRGQAAGHIIMFWLLTTLAALVFVPCVLVPVWVETEELYAVERQMASVVEDLEEVVARNEKRADALLHDPLVNRRVAQRELNLRSESEEVLHWSPEELEALRPPPVSATQAEDDPVELDVAPPWLAQTAAWLPDWPWRKLFAESPQRPILLLMAGGLLLAAFLLYAPTPQDKPQ